MTTGLLENCYGVRQDLTALPWLHLTAVGDFNLAHLLTYQSCSVSSSIFRKFLICFQPFRLTCVWRRFENTRAFHPLQEVFSYRDRSFCGKPVESFIEINRWRRSCPVNHSHTAQFPLPFIQIQAKMRMTERGSTS
jgi:hypothetical protein